MKQTTCDKCGAGPAFELLVAVSQLGIVRAGLPTATQMGGDFCEACAPVEGARLFQQAIEQQRRGIPVHRKLEDLSDQAAALEGDLRAAVHARDGRAQNMAARDVTKLEKAVTDIEDKLQAIAVERGQLLADSA